MKRIFLFCGHYGSGKTNLAVNFALDLKKKGYPTAIADIDIVNPYFRTKDSEKLLKDEGIEVISLPFANTNVDLPSLPSEVYSLVQNREKKAVFDVGGDDRGALALGRYVPAILEENDYEMIFVVNFFRPLTRSAEDALSVMKEIEAACGIPFSAIVNNSNLGEETAAEDVLSTRKECEKLSLLSSLPVMMTSAEKRIAGQIPGAFPLSLQKRPIDEIRKETRI